MKISVKRMNLQESESRNHLNYKNGFKICLESTTDLQRELTFAHEQNLRLTEELNESQITTQELLKEINCYKEINMVIMDEIRACRFANEILRDELNKKESELIGNRMDSGQVDMSESYTKSKNGYSHQYSGSEFSYKYKVPSRGLENLSKLIDYLQIQVDDGSVQATVLSTL